jgi:hypothetical protein
VSALRLLKVKFPERRKMLRRTVEAPAKALSGIIPVTKEVDRLPKG